ncbi:AcrR family transcriptional regulator [Spinactinospora alkalitolerans]|uniref:AcrR family transcriptional regulator n=1 Tax=Spinactinospora alkalitolerans TaxID=687207 RepID=A0A852U227_9ACTN|nr:TetR/AcrR family transcriptional regulator [Spinactinospora alkalitolerans]NYE50171.1 AcrR family transcriptional regulator [Spinactinospora alkalitolerans]
MPRGSTGRKGAAAWRWSRTAETRKGLLKAAREVFAERGFAEAGVAEVVERAGSSVGSMYHHFGGKAELFMALWEEHQQAHEHAAAAAVAAARASGEEDPLELFTVGARAFLEGSWERRDLARLFIDGDGPPGFELVRRTRTRKWVRHSAALLGAGSAPSDRMAVAVLTTVIAEAGREVAVCESAEEAEEVTTAALAFIRRLDPVETGGGGSERCGCSPAAPASARRS